MKPKVPSPAEISRMQREAIRTPKIQGADEHATVLDEELKAGVFARAASPQPASADAEAVADEVVDAIVREQGDISWAKGKAAALLQRHLTAAEARGYERGVEDALQACGKQYNAVGDMSGEFQQGKGAGITLCEEALRALKTKGGK